MSGLQLFTLVILQVAVEREVHHAQQAVHGRTQLMRHVGEKFALGLTRGQSRVFGYFQFHGPLPDAFFKQFLILADLFVRRRQGLDHAVEAFAQILDFVARAADPERLQPALPNRGYAGFEQL